MPLQACSPAALDAPRPNATPGRGNGLPASAKDTELIIPNQSALPIFLPPSGPLCATARYLLSLEARGSDRTRASVEASIRSDPAAPMPDCTGRALNGGLALGLAALRRKAGRRTV